MPGMSFAIPINTSKMIIDELLHYGRVRVTWTGISVSELSADEAKRLGLPAEGGLLVKDVAAGGPGASAGIARGDVIVEVNGSKVLTVERASRALFGMRVGDAADIVLVRSGKSRTVRLRLGEAPKGA